MDSDALARKYTGDAALEYDGTRTGSAKWRGEQHAVCKLLERLPPGSRLLDIPVGSGRFVPFYQEHGIVATGMDRSPDMLAQARLKVVSGKMPVDLRDGDIFAIDAPSESFDCALSIRLLNWIDTAQMCLAVGELARVSNRHVVVGMRHYVPLKELAPWSPRFRGQLLRRFLGKDGLVFHSRSDVYGAFAAVGLRIVDDIAVEQRGDGTDYHIYWLDKVAHGE
jgi:ubiquinone/menaquinone biosynthesis C-methylase UbiE